MSTILISDADTNVNFSVRINNQIEIEMLNDSDENWIQYLRDHRKLIREHSALVALDGETIHKFKYRIRKYLSSINSNYEELALAFRVVNRLNSSCDFNEKLETVYLPSLSYITELRKMYITLKSKISKMD